MPQRVDFYLLQSADEASRFSCACKIAAKAYQQGLRVYLRVADQARVETLDQLLWSYHPASFVPHCRARQASQLDSVDVAIGFEAAPKGWQQLLISLTDAVPDDANQFVRIADLISDQADAKASGRQRFKHYRRQGIQPTTHHIAG